MKSTLKVILINVLQYEIAYKLKEELLLLDIDTVICDDYPEVAGNTVVVNISELIGSENISIDILLEKVISKFPVEFDKLPLLTEGESKIVKILNDKIVVIKFKPTVYSYSSNRYGTVDGTAELRSKFTAEVFRGMNNVRSEKYSEILQNAFLALVVNDTEIMVLQRKVKPANVEIRVKRFHIGSPVHRYKYTEKYPTVIGDKYPLKKWDRFTTPIICFDWRHPLTDEEGTRLADEPISDDYASIWIEDVQFAKRLACNTFLWLEKLFLNAGYMLIDICFFIDQSGHYIFGEISPDCMRVREGTMSPWDLESFDKDIWRFGGEEILLSERYNRLYKSIFKKQL